VLYEQVSGPHADGRHSRTVESTRKLGWCTDDSVDVELAPVCETKHIGRLSSGATAGLWTERCVEWLEKAYPGASQNEKAWEKKIE
jgi:hypothetical protein